MAKRIQKYEMSFLLSVVIAVMLVPLMPISASAMISYWKFDEGEGIIAYDSANGNDGTLNGPLWTTGQVNNALSFDGIDDYVEVPDSSSLKPTDAITVEAWVKPTTVIGSNTIVSKYYGHGYYLRISGGAINFHGKGTLQTDSSIVPVGSWSHIAGTYDRTDSITKIYLDGELVKSGQTCWPAGNPLTHVDYNLRIGAWPVDAGLPFGGIIDEVAIYGRALSAEEIQQRYEDGLGSQDTTPPTINSISASPDVLWPPNHKMVEVNVQVEAVDDCDPAPVCRIVNVTSNEPINGPGDGNTEPDWEITGDLTVNLRAERAGVGTGRVYTIHIECMDVSGNTASATVDVTVPHDQGKGKK